jgi:hypothetical protein
MFGAWRGADLNKKPKNSNPFPPVFLKYFSCFDLTVF